MLSINLKSYDEAYKSLELENFNNYLNLFGIKLKDREKEDISLFIEEVSKELNSNKLSNFFIGYSIPQISKEFDLLRFGGNYNIDIEIKNDSTPDKIKRQLVQNRYYLSLLSNKTFLYTYIVKTKEVYTLDENSELEKINFPELVDRIKNQEYIKITNIDSLFTPSNYLVSPLNTTEKFMGNNYFLNGKQLESKIEIIRLFQDDLLKFAFIEGKPGTGKTLLTFDIAKHFIAEDWNVALFHCGKLSAGHIKLREEYGWDVNPVKNMGNVLTTEKKYNLIIVDETQRIYTEQLNFVIDYVNGNETKCIFSYDPEQFFSTSESNRKTIEKLEGSTLLYKKYKLTDKIRTNKEIASFITNLFDKSKVNPSIKYNNVHIHYFESDKSLRKYLHYLKHYEEWEVINFTSSTYNLLSYDTYQPVDSKNAHEVIGQEYDKVVAVINKHFFYGEDGKLRSRKESGSPDYRLDKMLYQILTRARQEITLIIYQNEKMLQACLKILGEL